MRILFMGTPEFALISLEKLIEAGEEVVGVITQPDRPRGRGRRVTASPVKAFAQEKAIPVYQPERLKDGEVLEKLAGFAPDLIVVVAYGKILPREVLELPPLGCINVHASLLPRYRGAAPIHWAIIRGEGVTGVTTMYIDEGMDTGDIILQEEVPILPEDNAGTLHDKLAHAGARLLLDTVARIKAGTAPRIPQPEEGVSYAPPLERTDEILDWNRPARQLWFQVRGLNPWPGAMTYWQGEILKVWEVSPLKGDGDAAPGEIIAVDKQEGILVGTGKGLLRLEVVQPAGKRRMTASDFARGYGVKEGLFFGGGA
ncbi:MAG: methionyl-tRNA formyltransferase [bacterium]|jgi:methionyl-tRNA formyltransferase|nr:methionyl-tRNA formyltransferase [Bacillota bacterium]